MVWVQMMFHLAMHLKALHENGYAHRDLKPGNLMWQPSRNIWTLIDFSCAARIGSMHDVALTVAYAAPEVVAEYRKGAKKIRVHEAVDAWSLGVVAFELLTGEPAAKLWVGRQKVCARTTCIGLHFIALPTLSRSDFIFMVLGLCSRLKKKNLVY